MGIQNMSRYKYKIIKIDHESYPQELKEIDKPPKQLYCAGDIELLNTKSAAIVGSRKFTSCGRQIAHLISRELAGAGVTIVSGMALGIDTFAHDGALSAAGKTIAVLGTGLNKVYPAANRCLMDRIYEEGLLISEYEPDFGGSRYTFPLRNRIISGVADCTIIVEAGIKSGALITASYALEQGKEIYAVPGNINSFASAGANQLIHDGATPLFYIRDVIEDLGLFYERKDTRLLALGEEEKELVSHVIGRNGVTVDDICRATNKNASKINSLITILELKGILNTYAGRIYYSG